MRTLFINRVLVESKADVNKGLIGIDNDTNGLTKLIRFIQVERLADLYIITLFLILQFVILVIYNYIEIING